MNEEEKEAENKPLPMCYHTIRPILWKRIVFELLVIVAGASWLFWYHSEERHDAFLFVLNLFACFIIGRSVARSWWLASELDHLASNDKQHPQGGTP